VNDMISPDFERYQAKVKGTNINSETLLATDYLNHFNEVVMMIEMLPDMPDCLDMVKEWQPKSYQNHFHDSTIADKDLAVECYDHVKPVQRKAFEDTIAQVDALIFLAVEEAEKAITTGDTDFLRFKVNESAQEVRTLQDLLSAIIHGTATLDQPQKAAVLDQNSIDALFD